MKHSTVYSQTFDWLSMQPSDINHHTTPYNQGVWDVLLSKGLLDSVSSGRSRALAVVILLLLRSLARHFTFTVPLFTRMGISELLGET